MNPRVSVLMSVYNDELFLEAALKSVLSQSFDDFELILINDGSTDRSREIMGSFHDPRIRIIDQENRGLTWSLNRAAREARGELLARQDADDRSLHERFEKQVELLEISPQLIALGSDWEVIDEQGKIQDYSFAFVKDLWIRTLLPLGNQFSHGSMMFRRSVFEQVGGYDCQYRYTQDYDLWWRLAQLGDVGNYPIPLYQHRRHQKSITAIRAEAQKSIAQDIRIKVMREWLQSPAGFARIVQEKEKKNSAIDLIEDRHSKERRKRFLRRLGQLGVALSILGRPGESQRVFHLGADMKGWLCHEGGMTCLSSLAPGWVRKWLIRRSRDLPFYEVFLNNDLSLL